MKAFKTSKIIFKNVITVDFQKNKKLLVLVNFFSIVCFPLFYILFYYAAWLVGIINRNDQLFYYFFFKFLPFKYMIILLGILFFISFIHELIHGLFFYLVTKEKPVFGYKFLYAYAGAPQWFIKKKYFLMISLSPFVIISFIGITALFFVNINYLSVVLIPLAAHAAACFGDIWFSFTLINKPAETYINDSGIKATINF